MSYIPNGKAIDTVTLRDYFAAKALQGLVASDVTAHPDEFSSGAYKLADAMLKERNK